MAQPIARWLFVMIIVINHATAAVQLTSSSPRRVHAPFEIGVGEELSSLASFSIEYISVETHVAVLRSVQKPHVYVNVFAYSAGGSGKTEFFVYVRDTTPGNMPEVQGLSELESEIFSAFDRSISRK